MHTPPACAPPHPREVHLWQWDLDRSDDTLDRDWELLSDEERRRAERFRFERHRNRFVAGRGRLRSLLASYLGADPQAVALEYGPEGKPYSLTQPTGWQLCFNLSHSENVAALAISNGFEIGIDVEHMRPIEQDMMREVFSPGEWAQFDSLPPSLRQEILFESWARKEACLKALGTGFAIAPTHFEFDLRARGDAAPLFVGGDADEAKLWRLRAFPALQACAGAVAARRTGWTLTARS